MEGGSSKMDLFELRVWMKISPPCEVSICDMVFTPVLRRCISSMTLRPESRKLVRHEDCRLFTSVGVILKVPEQWWSSLAGLPRGGATSAYTSDIHCLHWTP